MLKPMVERLTQKGSVLKDFSKTALGSELVAEAEKLRDVFVAEEVAYKALATLKDERPDPLVASEFLCSFPQADSDGRVAVPRLPAWRKYHNELAAALANVSDDFLRTDDHRIQQGQVLKDAGKVIVDVCFKGIFVDLAPWLQILFAFAATSSGAFSQSSIGSAMNKVMQCKIPDKNALPLQTFFSDAEADAFDKDVAAVKGTLESVCVSVRALIDIKDTNPLARDNDIMPKLLSPELVPERVHQHVEGINDFTEVMRGKVREQTLSGFVGAALAWHECPALAAWLDAVDLSVMTNGLDGFHPSSKDIEGDPKFIEVKEMAASSIEHGVLLWAARPAPKVSIMDVEDVCVIKLSVLAMAAPHILSMART